MEKPRVLSRLRKTAERALGVEITRVRKEPEKYSYLGEEAIIREHFRKTKVSRGFCVDIAASDGVTMSNTFALYRDQWSGLAAEADPIQFAALAKVYARFPNVSLVRSIVTPDNVIDLLSSVGTPAGFDFLNLDIDGYDYYVLRELLKNFRPALICAEINVKIPPPLKFTVNYDRGYFWNKDHFSGQSLSMLYSLAVQHSYSLVELHYNNAFLVPAELATRRALEPHEAFRIGYVEKPDRLEKFPWNKDFEPVINMEPRKAVEFFNAYFAKYAGRFHLDI